MVYIQNYKPMITTPKTEKSKRTITLPKFLVDIVKIIFKKILLHHMIYYLKFRQLFYLISLNIILN